MEPGTLIAIAISFFSTALQAAGLWILRDMHDRLVRLENIVMHKGRSW